jgi:molybdenum cofactor cytidylyltransferase
MSNIVGILLAAGNSYRFGSDKLCQLVSEEESIAARSCRHLKEAVKKVVAVIRPGAEELAETLAKTGASVKTCPRAHEGMGISLAFGIKETIDADGWIIALADMPWIKVETIRAVAAALAEYAIVAPYYAGKRGHPVGLSCFYREKLLALSGDEGAKSILQKNASQIRRLDCDDPGILLDIDRPSDLHGLQDKT